VCRPPATWEVDETSISICGVRRILSLTWFPHFPNKNHPLIRWTRELEEEEKEEGFSRRRRRRRRKV